MTAASNVTFARKRVRDTRCSHDEVIDYVLAPYLNTLRIPSNFGHIYYKAYRKFKMLQQSGSALPTNLALMDVASKSFTKYTATELLVAYNMMK